MKILDKVYNSNYDILEAKTVDIYGTVSLVDGRVVDAKTCKFELFDENSLDSSKLNYNDLLVLFSDNKDLVKRNYSCDVSYIVAQNFLKKVLVNINSSMFSVFCALGTFRFDYNLKDNLVNIIWRSLSFGRSDLGWFELSCKPPDFEHELYMYKFRE